ncbi:MAG: Regulatory protein AtoC [Pseudomonadota bacterium]
MRRATEAMALPDAHVLIGDSPAMLALRASIARLAPSGFPLLVQGESGVGKERVAIQLHRRSARRAAPFHAINCAALSPELLESQLFGCVRGAYTGADRDRPGLLEQLDSGTLLLDEVGEMPAMLQAKLLRVLEDGEYYRLGDTRPRHTGVRVLAATNRDLRAAVRAGQFREDLYHRLGVLKVNVPPLRARGEDWRQLLQYFCALHRDAFPAFTLDEAAGARLAAHPFPGNVRELRNVVVRLGMGHAGEVLSLSALEAALEPVAPASFALEARQPTKEDEHTLGPGFQLEREVAAFELSLIRSALARTQGNLSRAARLLGASRTSLYGKLARHGLDALSVGA